MKITFHGIAKELSVTRTVALSVGSRQRPLPQRPLGRDIFWWLTKARVFDRSIESRLGRTLSRRETLKLPIFDEEGGCRCAHRSAPAPWLKLAQTKGPSDARPELA